MPIPLRHVMHPPSIVAVDPLEASRHAQSYGCRDSTDFWHTHGDVVICVQNVHYRVDRRALAAESDLFKPFLDLELHPGMGYISCRVTHHDVYSWERVLEFLYRRVKLISWMDSATTPDVLLLIHFARTIHFNDVVLFCIGKLKAALPTTLSAFDAAYKPTALTTNRECLFKTITLLNFESRLHPTTLTVPAYLLALIETTPGDVVDGVECADGTRVYLQWDARTALLHAHAEIDRLIYTSFSNLLSGINHNDVPCASKPSSVACRAAADSLSGRTLGRFFAFDEKGAWRRRLVMTSRPTGEFFEEALESRCQACRVEVERQLCKAREAFWNGLPKLFKLADNWEALSPP